MSTETDVILAELRRIQVALEQITKRLGKAERGHVEARAVTVQQVAKMLSQGLTKTRAMVKAGQIATIEIGGRRMVAVSEVERLTAPEPGIRRHSGGGRPKTKSMSGSELKAWLTKQGKRGQ